VCDIQDIEYNVQRDTIMVLINLDYLDGTGVTRMNLYELNKLDLSYIDHWWTELSDFTGGRLKKMVFEGDDIFYLTY